MDLTLIPPSALFDHTPDRPPLTVLLAEDDPAQRAILVKVLENNNFQVTACLDVGSSKQALNATTFDAVLSDLHLADENGLDVLWEAARVQPDCARILMSASSSLPL